MSEREAKIMALETVIIRCQHVKFDFTHLISKDKDEILKPAGYGVSLCNSSWLHVPVTEAE